MKFRLPLQSPVIQDPISYSDRLLLIGSCFTEHIFERLNALKFRVMQNPHGIMFNPQSIATALRACIEKRSYTANDLVYINEAWHSWQHHSIFSHPDCMQAAQKMTESSHAAHAFLQQADWAMLTLGSAFVYELVETGTAVANCHRAPAQYFRRRLLGIDECIILLRETFQMLLHFRPTLRFVLTISPVRHLREGFIDNSRSKATLVHAVHTILAEFKQAHYFPAYELVLDDLRDYRFFAEDMVHPNYLATQYVWEQFAQTCLSSETQKQVSIIEKLLTARRHRPFNPQSDAHRRFLSSHLEHTLQLQRQMPDLDWNEELQYFATN